MTRAGAVAEMPVPSRVVTDRVREPGPQTDGANRQGEVEGEFSELLSKLKNGAEPRSDQSAAVLPDGVSAPTDWKGARHRTSDVRMPEKGIERVADPRAASGLSRGDIDLADGALLGAPPEAAKLGTPATAPLEADDTGTAESIAAILTLTSSNTPGVNAPNASEQPSQAGQGAGPGVPPKAISGANVVMDVAEQVAPLDQKDAVRSRTPSADAAFTSSADVPKSTMPGTVVAPPAKEDLPKANVVRQEAHFPPAVASTMHARGGVAAVAGGKLGTGSEAKGESAPLIDTGPISTEDPASGAVPAPTQQIANRIAAEVSAFEVVDRIQPEPNQVAAKPVLKVLQIQLQPAELGTVSIRMELREGVLELHVEAAKAETAEIIRGDRDTLSNLLRSSGYNIDANTIRVAEVDRTTASQQSGQQGAQTNLQSSAQQQYGGAERNAREHRDTGGSSGGDTSTQASRTDNHETNTSRANGGLYI